MTELAPLSARVSAPSGGSPLPPDADGVRWRRASATDLDELIAVHRVIDAEDHPEFRGADELESTLSAGYFDAELDTALAEIDGQIVASGFVAMPDGWESHVQIFLTGGVHPAFRGRGIGRALFGWQRARSLERLSAIDDTLPSRIIADADSRVAGQAPLFARFGFAPDRTWLYMVHRLDGVQPAQIAPPLALVEFGHEFDESLRVVKNAVFVADHWGSQPETPEHWEHHVLVPTLRRELSRLAVDADHRIAGFTVVTVVDDQPAEHRIAYIALVGVDRDFRGRGVAQAVVGDALAQCAAAGIHEVGLHVDDTSPTGADRLYLKLGFVASHETVSWVLAH